MRKLLFITAFLIMISGLAFAASGDVQLLKQARAQIRLIAGELQAKVARDVKDEGAENALASCRLQVSGITDRLSLHSGWEIRRVSFKPRNPDNVPDPWESDVLRLFEKRLAEGVDPSSYEFAKVLNIDGRRVFRYMKPIIVQDFCITCHGSDLAPPIQSKIAEKYPGDRAVDYLPGELRGAFSMYKILPGDPPQDL